MTSYQKLILETQIALEELDMECQERSMKTEEFHWYDEYATLNFFQFIRKNIEDLAISEQLV